LDGLADVFDRYENRKRVHTIATKFAAAWRTRMPGNRNLMFLIIGALIVVVGVLGYNLYEAKKEPKGVQINVGPDGLKIQNK
jgi:type II secretory pathway component PulM